MRPLPPPAPTRSAATGVALILLAVSLPLSGCMVAAVGAAAGFVGVGPERQRIRGEVDATLAYDYPLVAGAVGDVLTELKFNAITRQEETAASTIEYSARTQQDRSITIGVRKEGEKLTKIKIQMGVFGDKDTSEAVLTKIRARLQNPA